MKLIKKLLTYNRKSKWQAKAQEFLDVLIEHHCSSFFKSPLPQDFKEFYEKIKEPRDLTLIGNLLNKKEYSTLKDFIQDLYLVWSNIKQFYPPNSFFYKQASSLETFMTHLIKEEGVFDSFRADNTTSGERTRTSANVHNNNVANTNKEESEDMGIDLSVIDTK